MSTKTTRRITVLMGLGIFGLGFNAQAATPNQHRTGPKDLRQTAKVTAEGKQDSKRMRRMEAKDARRAKTLALLDTNRDGALQISELVSHRQMKMKARLQKADTNGDGILQDGERKTARQARKAHKVERRSKRKGDKANKIERSTKRRGKKADRRTRRARRRARASNQQ